MGTKIRWTQETWNPITGCSKVSPGCAHCYAERLSLRYGFSKKPWLPENAAENVVLHPERLEMPLHWQKPRRVFVNSMSDLFHEQVPDDFIEAVFAVMSLAGKHVFQVLTKRPARMRDFLNNTTLDRCLAEITTGKWFDHPIISLAFRRNGDQANVSKWPLPNVWLGTSVENQHWADIRVPLLLETPAAVRFLSCEPLLGPLDLYGSWFPEYDYRPTYDYYRAVYPSDRKPVKLRDGIDWVIAGGESGSGFRKMDMDWARSLRDQCQDADVAFFFKQSSGYRSETGTLLDGVEWSQYPSGQEA